ncbi:MAG: hypothetical protein LBB41_02710 [Prevotellaceae bacterium]|jgi:hypothetical protein|nr:hypothetical protein [Prevotellaceae bacterium]
MKKNNKPYGQARCLEFAFTSDFEYFALLKNQFLGKIKSESLWHRLNEVSGSLNISVVPDSANELIFDVKVNCRVAYDSPGNRNEIDALVGRALILRYKSGGGLIKMLGTTSAPLYLKVEQPEGLEGYNCIFEGMMLTREIFV